MSLHLLSTLRQKKPSELLISLGFCGTGRESAVLLHVVLCQQPLICCARRGKEPQDRIFGKVGELNSHEILQVPGLSWAAIESRQFLI